MKTIVILPFLLRLYLGFTNLLEPIWLYVLNRRLQHGKETPNSVAQKQMLNSNVRPTGALIWGHAVGVGEALALAGLFAQLAQRLPQHHFLITSTAKTSAQALNIGQLPPRCQHQFAPIDTPKAVQAFLAHWQPCIAVWCELDLWPGLIGVTHSLGIPMFLVNARLSEASLKHKYHVKAFYSIILNQFNEIYCQNAATANGFKQLGAISERLIINGSIKALAQPLAADSAKLIMLQAQLGTRPCWLLASSHEGEEAMTIAAHQIVRQTLPTALLLIAPRYPQRGAVLAQRYDLNNVQRSRGAAISINDSIYLCDTIGEMGLWYRLSSIAFIGGSFVSIGGHNPYEALNLNCAILSGQYVYNFQESYDDLIAQGLAQVVNSSEALAAQIIAKFQLSEIYTADLSQVELYKTPTKLLSIFNPMLDSLCKAAKN